MSLMRIFKGLQGKVSQKSEDLADTMLIDELDQRIRDAKTKQNNIDNKTNQVVASQAVIIQEIETIQAEMEKLKGQLAQAVEKKGKEDPICAKIVSELNKRKNLISEKQPQADELGIGIESLRKQKSANDISIQKMEREKESLKANQLLIDAKKANAEMLSGQNNSVESAGDATARLKKKQAAEMAALDAQAENIANSGTKSLDDELAEMGIGDSADVSMDEWLS